MFDEIRVVFFGTTDFACRMLQTLIEEKYNVVAAVSQPDRPVGRKHVIKPTDVHQYCLDHKIPCIQPEKLRKQSEEVLTYHPDLIVTCAYGQIVPDDILAYPSRGCLNIHPSLLPKYRGGAPMHHAIWSGDKETGVCLMEMTHAMDAGKVYAHTIVPIGEDDTTADLEPKLMDSAASLLKDALPAYLEGKLPGVPQDESKVVIARNISPQEEQIHFQSESLPEIYNHIRALIDWPVPYGMIEGKRMKFYKVRKQDENTEHQAGEVLGFEEGAMAVAVRGGKLLIYELQPEGRKRMDARAFENGIGREYIGKRFE